MSWSVPYNELLVNLMTADNDYTNQAMDQVKELITNKTELASEFKPAGSGGTYSFLYFLRKEGDREFIRVVDATFAFTDICVDVAEGVGFDKLKEFARVSNRVIKIKNDSGIPVTLSDITQIIKGNNPFKGQENGKKYALPLYTELFSDTRYKKTIGVIFSKRKFGPYFDAGNKKLMQLYFDLGSTLIVNERLELLSIIPTRYMLKTTRLKNDSSFFDIYLGTDFSTYLRLLEAMTEESSEPFDFSLLTCKFLASETQAVENITKSLFETFNKKVDCYTGLSNTVFGTEVEISDDKAPIPENDTLGIIADSNLVGVVSSNAKSNEAIELNNITFELFGSKLSGKLFPESDLVFKYNMNTLFNDSTDLEVELVVTLDGDKSSLSDCTIAGAKVLYNGVSLASTHSMKGSSLEKALESRIPNYFSKVLEDLAMRGA